MMEERKAMTFFATGSADFLTDDVGDRRWFPIDLNLRVVAAACRFGPLTLSMPPPARHHTILQTVHFLGGNGRIPPSDQGFLLSDGTYCDRERALLIATAAGQLVKRPEAARSPIAPPNLYSEDMW